MRLFIAITLPPQIKQQLAAYAASLGALAQRAHPTREDNFYLTLAFLGDALTESAAIAALKAITGAPFKLYSDKPGKFTRGNSEIHWLGLKSSAELATLHSQLNDALAAAGFTAEKRPFAPHITLAREVRGLAKAQLPPPPRFIIPVSGLTLFNSARVENLLTYGPLYEKHF